MAVQGRTHTDRHSGYEQIRGNTVRKLRDMPAGYGHPAVVEAPSRRPMNHSARRNREKARYMNLGYVFFMAGALIISGFILTVYLGLQSDITNSIKNIASLERQLNDLRMENDEEYNRIMNSVDLEEIRRIAIQELGMIYAEEGQIIDFTGSKDDYVRQDMELPE